MESGGCLCHDEEACNGGGFNLISPLLLTIACPVVPLTHPSVHSLFSSDPFAFNPTKSVSEDQLNTLLVFLVSDSFIIDD